MPFPSADAREWAAGEVTRMQAQLAPLLRGRRQEDDPAPPAPRAPRRLRFGPSPSWWGRYRGGSRRCPARISASWCRLNAPMSISGFYDIFGKFASVIGPMLYSLFYMVTGRASIGIISLLVPVRRGRRPAAGGTEAPAGRPCPGKRRLNTDAMHVRRGGGPMMTPIVLFDLYDTPAQERSFDFGRGLDMLYETGFHTVCSREELVAYAAAFLPAYEARKPAIRR